MGNVELPEELRQHIDRINRLLATQNTMPNKLEAIAEVIERTIPGADAVSIALVVGDATVTGAASSRIAVEADLVQYGHNQGPCITSVRKQTPVRIDVLRQDERYDHFAPGALEVGVESVLSVPIFWAGDVVGSVNLYSREPRAFSGATLGQLAPVVEYAAEVISHSPLYAETLGLVEGLVATVADADDIQLAIGILLGRGVASEEAAWSVLRADALRAGEPIADTARRVISGAQSAQETRGDL
jgi:GAF domain-containing protein